MEWITVDSSSLITGIGHEGTTLFLRFKSGGNEYTYANVSQLLYMEMRAAESIGKFFIANIKNNPNHPATRLLPVTPSAE